VKITWALTPISSSDAVREMIAEPMGEFYRKHNIEDDVNINILVFVRRRSGLIHRHLMIIMRLTNFF